MSRKLFCFGLGLSARTLARHLKGDDWSICGTTRSPEKAARLAESGLQALIFDRRQPQPGLESALTTSTHLLISIAPDEAGDPVLDCYGDLISSKPWNWVGYLSTTGVYGDRKGDWVDETSDLRPTAERSRRRAQAESAWMMLHEDHQVPLHIFRLAGIYGPGRNALKSLRQGKAKRIRKPGQVFSRIHSEDIAQVLRASMARPEPGRVYNVCDDQAAPPEEVIAYAADLLQVPPPPLEDIESAGLSAMARSFYRDNKRVRNTRMHEELGITLKYPNYKLGLDALLAAGE